MENKSLNKFFVIEAVSDSWKPMLKLKDKVRFLLLSKGMSQNNLADEIGINKGTLSKILNRDWVPSSRIKILIAQKLGVDSLVIFGDEGYFLDYQRSIKQREGEEND